jgi:hypothetical protein
MPMTIDDIAQHLRATERARLAALVGRDLPLAQALHAPDFQLVTPGGRAFTRDEYLGRIERGDLRYLRWEPDEIAVRVHGDAAVLRYTATLQLDSDDGPGDPFRCWHIDSYERDAGGAWQVVWSQATAIR